jgi:hypothetical protein
MNMGRAKDRVCPQGTKNWWATARPAQLAPTPMMSSILEPENSHFQMTCTVHVTGLSKPLTAAFAIEFLRCAENLPINIRYQPQPPNLLKILVADTFSSYFRWHYRQPVPLWTVVLTPGVCSSDISVSQANRQLFLMTCKNFENKMQTKAQYIGTI